MGFLPCPCPIKEKTLRQSSITNHLHSDPSNSSSLSSQPSLPSLPSLTASPPSAAVDHHCAATLKGHSSCVFALALAGKHLFSGSYAGKIRTWTRRPPTGSQNFLATAGGAAVKSLVVSGDKLFSAHQDHKIRVWKVEENQKDAVSIATIPTLEDRFLTLFSAKNYVQVRRHKTCTWVHHLDTVSALAISHDGSNLYSASWDRTVKIWRTSDFRCLESIPNAHDDAINAVAVSYNGLVYTGSADTKIKVWRRRGRRKSGILCWRRWRSTGQRSMLWR